MKNSHGTEKSHEKHQGKGLGKAKLSKASLEKFGQMSLQDKMKAAAEEAEDPDQAAIALHGSMPKLEKSKAWSKHQTVSSMAPRRRRQLTMTCFLLEKEGKSYMSALKKVSVGEKAIKNDDWQAELQILAKFTQDELGLHLQSGRVVWSECPSAWGVYEYKDTQSFHREVTTKRKREWQSGA
jgi:hypothetical protein